MSILEDILNKAKKHKEKILSKLQTENQVHNAKMEELFKEMQGLVTDSRYPNQQEYLIAQIDILLVDLLHILVIDTKSISRQDTLPKAQAIAGRLYNYLEMIGRADKFFKDYQDYLKITKSKEEVK